jgi:hypothetical protein
MSLAAIIFVCTYCPGVLVRVRPIAWRLAEDARCSPHDSNDKVFIWVGSYVLALGIAGLWPLYAAYKLLDRVGIAPLVIRFLTSPPKFLEKGES